MSHHFQNKILHYGVVSLIYGVGIMTLGLHIAMAFPSVMAILPMSDMHESCTTIGQTHVITIQPDSFSPSHLTVSKCDRVVFTNEDPQAIHLPAIGTHSHHMELGGFIEKELHAGERNTFIASTQGNYMIHDHLHDEIHGTLTIQ